MPAPRFPQTSWSLIARVGAPHTPQGHAALVMLCEAYWYPVYAFIRLRGGSDERARDRTQGFFTRLLEKNDLATVDPTQGKRFRSWLLACVQHYLANEHDREHAQGRARREEVLAANEYAARAAAGAVLWQIAEYAELMERAAADPAPAALLSRGDAEALTAYCRARLEGSPFSSFFIVDTDGVLRAHWPPVPPRYIGRNYAFRDYFPGAMRAHSSGSGAAYVARAFRSEVDQKYKFGISALLRAADGAPVGVIIGAIASAARLGGLELSDGRRVAALVAPRDRERHEAMAPLPEDRMIVLHDGVEHGQGVLLRNAVVDRLAPLRRLPDRPARQLALAPPDQVASDGDYRDPLGAIDPRYRGPWLAGMAPVGGTELVVVVQTRLEDAVELDRAPLRRLAWSGAAALLVQTAALAFALHRTRRRRVAAHPPRASL